MGVKDYEKYRLQVMGQAKLPKLGEGELLKLGGRQTFREIFSLPTTEEAPPAVEREPLIPMSLVDAHSV